MILLLCNECQLDMYFERVIINVEGNAYRQTYVLRDENNHIFKYEGSLVVPKDSIERRILDAIAEENKVSS